MGPSTMPMGGDKYTTKSWGLWRAFWRKLAHQSYSYMNSTMTVSGYKVDFRGRLLLGLVEFSKTRLMSSTLEEHTYFWGTQRAWAMGSIYRGRVITSSGLGSLGILNTTIRPQLAFTVKGRQVVVYLSTTSSRNTHLTRR